MEIRLLTLVALPRTGFDPGGVMDPVGTISRVSGPSALRRASCLRPWGRCVTVADCGILRASLINHALGLSYAWRTRLVA